MFRLVHSNLCSYLPFSSPFFFFPLIDIVLFLSVMGSVEHPLSSLTVEGSVTTDGENFERNAANVRLPIADSLSGHPGGGSGGTILLFLRTLALSESANLSSVGGYGSSDGAGAGGGGRIHFHWSDIPTGDVYQPIASVEGNIHARFVL